MKILCGLLGHRAVVTDSIATTPGNYWHQETCLRCGAKRQFTTHNWGRSTPTPWVVS